MKQHSKQLHKRIILVAVIVTTGIVSSCSGTKEVTKVQANIAKPEIVEEVSEPLNITAGAATTLAKIVPVTEEITETPDPVQTPLYTWSEHEAYLLAKIAMAEAEGEDTEGKALVILTILNRIQCEKFPDTIEGIIYQKDQFEPITNGRFDRVEPNEDCYKALELVKNGWDESQGALYFERTTTESTWHSRNLDELFDHGNHTFYKE